MRYIGTTPNQYGDTLLTSDADDQINVKVAGAEDFRIAANTFEVQTGSNIDMNGTELILDADGDTSITADSDDTIDFRIAGADDFQMTANILSVLSGSTLNIDSGATIANSGTATGFGSFDPAEPGEIGGTTPAAATFTSLELNGFKIQVFDLRLRHVGGVLVHSFRADNGAGGAGNFVDRVNGVVDASETTSPTGTDGSTAMDAGGKICTVWPFDFILDTGDFAIPGNTIAISGQAETTAGTSLCCEAILAETDVNGTTIMRMHLRFSDLGDGSVFNINTTNIANTKRIGVRVLCFLPDLP